MAHVANPPLAPRVLLHALAKHWWLLLLRGICAILFGVLTFVLPGITLLTLVCRTSWTTCAAIARIVMSGRT
jgi:uncharacterized membrane protein HdeD (DUF308 family)